MDDKIRLGRHKLPLLELSRGGVDLEDAAKGVSPSPSSQDLAFQAVHRATERLKENGFMGRDEKRLRERDRQMAEAFDRKERFVLGEVSPVPADALVHALDDLRAGRTEPMKHVVHHALALSGRADRRLLADAVHLDIEHLSPLVDELVREGRVEDHDGELSLPDRTPGPR
ncbi:MAG: hypothetical protein QF415_10195 [Candidatus Undinarchaeales archaeon]|jgi:hypothetical protein|nr:hypothetical protein [Candidatus Undinarchaeales archaeon]MDP7494202.1 hypothetical protein [Candidatus Undinarchaeales archaeon]